MSFEFHASTKATHRVKRTVYDYRNGDFDGLRGALEALNLCAREFKITPMVTATGTSLNKRFNEQNNGCPRTL